MAVVLLKLKSQKGGKGKRREDTERALVHACLEYLQWRGCVALRVNSGLMILGDNGRKRAIKLAGAGTFDIIACLPGGRFLAVECKTEKGRLTEKQKEFLERVRRLGGIAVVVRSVDDLERVFVEGG